MQQTLLGLNNVTHRKLWFHRYTNFFNVPSPEDVSKMTKEHEDNIAKVGLNGNPKGCFFKRFKMLLRLLVVVVLVLVLLELMLLLVAVLFLYEGITTHMAIFTPIFLQA